MNTRFISRALVLFLTLSVLAPQNHLFAWRFKTKNKTKKTTVKKEVAPKKPASKKKVAPKDADQPKMTKVQKLTLAKAAMTGIVKQLPAAFEALKNQLSWTKPKIDIVVRFNTKTKKPVIGPVSEADKPNVITIGLSYSIGVGAGNPEAPFRPIKAVINPKVMFGIIPTASVLDGILNAIGGPIAAKFKSLMVFDPGEVFIIKVLCLLNSAARNKGKADAYPQLKDVAKEMMTLFSRFAKTPKLSIDALFKKLPGPIYELVKKLPEKSVEKISYQYFVDYRRGPSDLQRKVSEMSYEQGFVTKTYFVTDNIVPLITADMHFSDRLLLLDTIDWLFQNIHKGKGGKEVSEEIYQKRLKVFNQLANDVLGKIEPLKNFETWQIERLKWYLNPTGKKPAIPDYPKVSLSIFDWLNYKFGQFKMFILNKPFPGDEKYLIDYSPLRPEQAITDVAAIVLRAQKEIKRAVSLAKTDDEPMRIIEGKGKQKREREISGAALAREILLAPAKEMANKKSAYNRAMRAYRSAKTKFRKKIINKKQLLEIKQDLISAKKAFGLVIKNYKKAMRLYKKKLFGAYAFAFIEGSEEKITLKEFMIMELAKVMLRVPKFKEILDKITVLVDPLLRDILGVTLGELMEGSEGEITVLLEMLADNLEDDPSVLSDIAVSDVPGATKEIEPGYDIGEEYGLPGGMETGLEPGEESGEEEQFFDEPIEVY